MPYKLVTGAHTRWEGDKQTGSFVRYKAGTENDTMEDLSPEELASFGQRVQQVSAPRTKAKSAAPKEEDDFSFFTELSAKDAVAFVKDVETVEEAQALRDAEAAQEKPRSTVLDAADTRISQLNKGE